MSADYAMIALGWLSAVLFVGVSAYRIARIARLPLNVRWEVYPVPHEAKEKRHYGGSYMEQLDWATAKREASLLPAYVEIAAEVTTLKRVREHNGYGLWPLSLAMHWGLYLYFGWLLLLLVGNAVHIAGLSYLTVGVGVAALVMGASGALGLMVKRASTPDLHRYTTPADYFNLLFLSALFLAGLVSWLGDTSFAAHKAYIRGVLFFRPVHVPAAVAVSFLLFELFMIYMPFTKLIHYFAKYFTFDRALWDDAFKAKGSAVDRQVASQLAFNAEWSAPHVVPGQTWLQQVQATALPERKK
jgi:nitrate reductase gamma subunit